MLTLQGLQILPFRSNTDVQIVDGLAAVNQCAARGFLRRLTSSCSIHKKNQLSRKHVRSMYCNPDWFLERQISKISAVRSGWSLSGIGVPDSSIAIRHGTDVVRKWLIEIDVIQGFEGACVRHQVGPRKIV